MKAFGKDGQWKHWKYYLIEKHLHGWVFGVTMALFCNMCDYN
jgi:hypothetical protein